MKTDGIRRNRARIRLLAVSIAASMLCAGMYAAEADLSAKSHYLAAANNRDEAAATRMAYARKLFGSARDLPSLPIDETGQRQANLNEAAHVAQTSAKHAAKAVVNYDKAASILRTISNYTANDTRYSPLNPDDYLDKADETKKKALLSAIFVAEAYEWAAALYAENHLSPDKQAGALEQAAAWRENIASRILQK